MDITLKRTARSEAGAFGYIPEMHLYTLEHAYPTSDASFSAKIPAGTYVCKRSSHRLHGMTEDFVTFEVTGVPGHSGILFHWGNYNKDSEGCILLGMGKRGDDMITLSRVAFEDFMNTQQAVQQFTLTVTNEDES